MAVSLSATMTRRVISATVSGMDPEYLIGRTFKWYLDGKLQKTETLMGSTPTNSFSVNGVTYVKTHTVSVEIFSYTTGALLASPSVSVADTLALWNWQASNGDATVEQTQAAYTAITSHGLAANFSHLVWNDLAINLNNVLEAGGRYWYPYITSLQETLMEAGDPLTDKRFNGLVRNMQTPYMFWVYQTEKTGYIGRLLVQGQETYGDNADIVYGSYLLYLAYFLNVLVDAVGDFNAGYAKKLAHSDNSSLSTREKLPMRSPKSRRMSIDDILYLETLRLKMRDPDSRRMKRTDRIESDASMRLRSPKSRQMVSGNRVRSYRMFDLIAQNEQLLSSDSLIEVIHHAELLPDLAVLLGCDQHALLVAEAMLSTPDSHPFSLVDQLLTGLDGVLYPAPATDLLLNENSKSGVSAIFDTDEESVFDILSKSFSTTNTGLLLDPSTPFTVVQKILSSIDATGRVDKSDQLVHVISPALRLTGTAQMHDCGSALMTHKAEAMLHGIFLADMLVPRIVGMQYATMQTMRITSFAEMVSNASAQFAYHARKTLSSALSSSLFADDGIAMAVVSQELLKSVASGLLSPALSEYLTAIFEERVKETCSIAFDPADSCPFGATLNERLNDVCEAMLTPADGVILVINETVSGQLSADFNAAASSAVAHTGAEKAMETVELEAPPVSDCGIVSVCITAFAAVLEAKPVVVPTTDWAVQEDTNLDIRRTYYNHADGSTLLIDQAWYQDPVQVGTNLAITSEGYNDYGLGAENENKV